MKNLEFEDFLYSIKSEIAKGLPGWEAQKRMTVPGRPDLTLEEIEARNPRQSAVLLWLYPNSGEIFTRLIVRTSGGSNHNGQVAFPGGSYDKTDGDFWHTALEEANEEIGLEPGEVSFVGELSPLYIPPSNFQVRAFIGASDAFKDAIISKHEVQKYFDINISLLLDDNLKGEMAIKRSLNESEFITPCYNLGGYAVWGATAMILSEFEEIIKNIFFAPNP